MSQIHDLGDEMQPATPLAAARQREIDAGQIRRALLETGLTRVDRALELALQRVGGAADALALVGLQSGEGLEDFGEGAGLAAQELGLELLEPAFIRLRNLVQTLPQRI